MATRTTVLPENLPPETEAFISETVRRTAVVNGLEWVVRHMVEEGERDAIDLAERFLTAYEEQVRAKRGEHLNGNLPVFRTALLLACLEVFPRYRMRLADLGYNPLFLRTWLEKQLMANLLGVTRRDIEMKIRNSRQRPPEYLRKHLPRLMNDRCVKALKRMI